MKVKITGSKDIIDPKNNKVKLMIEYAKTNNDQGNAWGSQLTTTSANRIFDNTVLLDNAGAGGAAAANIAAVINANAAILNIKEAQEVLRKS